MIKGKCIPIVKGKAGFVKLIAEDPTVEETILLSELAKGIKKLEIEPLSHTSHAGKVIGIEFNISVGK